MVLINIIMSQLFMYIYLAIYVNALGKAVYNPQRIYVNAIPEIYNAKTDCNAKGNGVNDDTLAIQNCSNLLSSTGGVLYFPTGIYTISSAIIFNNFGNDAEIKGDGWTSIIEWSMNEHLFYFNGTNPTNQITIQNMKILSTNQNKTVTNSAFYFKNGLTQSEIRHILITNDNNNNFNWGSGIICNAVCDTNFFVENLLWELSGTGYQIGYGSEVRIDGGRIIGKALRNDGSIGIHCTGNNGGVHVVNTDVIALGTGLLLENINGKGSNREIFITQATFDSNGRGISVKDNSYISVSGLWAASSDYEQIWVDVNLNPGPLIIINGGTIFNGGVYGGINCSNGCNGITVNSGSFILNGVAIRNNKGKGIWIANDKVNGYIITNCKIFSNGIGYKLNGVTDYIFNNNICNNNGVYNHSFKINDNNIGC
eukprot:31413_1